MDVERISLTEAARRVGVTMPAVLKATRTNRLSRGEDGLVGAADVAAWNESRRTPRGGDPRGSRAPITEVGGKVSQPSSVDGEAARKARAALEATMGPGGLYADRASAELARDSFQARLKQLEFEERSGRLVDRDAVAKAMAGALSKLRSALLAMPSECGPELARMKTPAEVTDALRKLLTDALDALCTEIEKAG